MPAGLVCGLKDLRAALAGFDAGIYSGEDCAVLADELAATEKACAAARLLAACRAVEAGAHRERGFSDGADWLARQSGTTGSQARRALDTARRLGDCPDTRNALLAGEVSLEQAKEITEMPAEAQAELLGTARGGDLREVRERAREYRQGHTDPGELRQRQLSMREFRHWRDPEGMVRFCGALPPERGLVLVRRVEAAAARLRRAAKQAVKGTAGRVDRFDAYAADALVDLVSAAGGGGGNGKGRGASVDLVVVADLNAWRAGRPEPGEVCHIIGGGPIPVEVAKELSRDAFLKAVIHDGVNVHTIKHFGRHYPALLRTALDIGDPPGFKGRCCIDCGKPFGLERDHDNPLANGGATQLDNLGDRCYSCHKTKTARDRQAGLLGPNPPTGSTQPNRPRKLKTDGGEPPPADPEPPPDTG